MPDPKSSYERLTQLPADATLTPAQRSDLDLQLANPLLASAKKKALRAHLPRESAMIDRRTGKLRNTTIVVCVLIIATGATLSSIFGPHRAEPTSAAAAAGGGARVVAHNVAPGIDLIAGEAHHVEEASTQERDAVDLISAREGHPESASTSPGQWVDAIYHRASYRHFGGAGESPLPR